MLENSWVAELLAASQEGLSSMSEWMNVGQLPPAHAGSSLADFYTLKMEAMRFSETLFTQDVHDAKVMFLDNRNVVKHS
jgi:hypothetical protein